MEKLGDATKRSCEDGSEKTLKRKGGVEMKP